MVLIPSDMMQTVIESPDSEYPRLVISDWLEENGDIDRAEFIRIQIKLSGMTCRWCHGSSYINLGHRCKSCGTEELRDKERAIWDRLQHNMFLLTRWSTTYSGIHLDKPMRTTDMNFRTSPIYPLPFGICVYRRGFIENLGVTFQEWWDYGPQVVNLIPLRQLTFQDKEPSNVRRKSGGKRIYAWFKHDIDHNEATRWRSTSRDILPPEWMPKEKRRVNFDTLENANLYLQAEAIRWAKEQAKLLEVV